MVKLAEIADRIFDHSTQSQVMTTNNPNSEPPTNSQQPAVDVSEERLANMEKKLGELTTTVKNIQISLKTSTDTSEHR
jgi:hypothetical protein